MKHRTAQLGFTMIELLVTIGIFTVLTGVVLAKYRTFNSNVSLANATEDIVLALRQSQVYGAGTKGHTVSCQDSPTDTNPTSFKCAYGVHLGMQDLIKHRMRSFIDVNGNGVYDSGDTDLELVQWGDNIITSLLCDGLACTGDLYGSLMDVTFRRPSPDAYIVDTPLAPTRHLTGQIVVSDTNTGRSSTITVTAAGQISVQ